MPQHVGRVLRGFRSLFVEWSNGLVDLIDDWLVDWLVRVDCTIPPRPPPPPTTTTHTMYALRITTGMNKNNEGWFYIHPLDALRTPRGAGKCSPILTKP